MWARAGLVAALGLAGCDGVVGGTVYCCTYEWRTTGCGGIGWKEWESESYEFDLDDYLDDWDEDRVCDKFTGIDIECGGTCCIDVEYRNNDLRRGPC